jgi:predicted XRE-type DNA-binding protein
MASTTAAAHKAIPEQPSPHPVWDQITCRRDDASIVMRRSDLMAAIRDVVRDWKTTQTKAADRLGISQSRLNHLLSGKIDKFRIDSLAIIAERAGLKVKIAISSSCTDNQTG